MLGRNEFDVWCDKFGIHVPILGEWCCFLLFSCSFQVLYELRDISDLFDCDTDMQ